MRLCNDLLAQFTAQLLANLIDHGPGAIRTGD